MKKGIKYLSILIVICIITVFISTVTAQKEDEQYQDQKDGVAAIQKGNYDQAVVSFSAAVKKAMKLPQNEKNINFVLFNYSNLGLAYKRLNDFDQALSIYGELMEFAPYSSSVWYFNMAETYKEMAKFNNDASKVNEAIKILNLLSDRKSKIKDFSIYEAYYNGDIGELYSLKADYNMNKDKNYSGFKNDLKNAQNYAKASINILKKKNRSKSDNDYLARMYYNRGSIYYRQYMSNKKLNDKEYLERLQKDLKNGNKNLKNAIKYYETAKKYKADFIEAQEALDRLQPKVVAEVVKQQDKIKRDVLITYDQLKKEEAKNPTPNTSKDEYPESPEAKTLKMAMFKQLNLDRKKHQDPVGRTLEDVQIDILCTKVGDFHNKQSQENQFMGHQLMDGYDPYYHYSQAGGNDYHAQNAAGRWGYSKSQKPTQTFIEWILDSQYRMYSEVPPNDGHRVCMLDPRRTHVGIGLAYAGDNMYCTEEFVNRYANIKDIPRQAKLNDALYIEGKPLSDQYRCCGAMICYQPFAKPMTPKEINETWHYGLPSDRITVYPKLDGGYTYRDGSKGDIEISSDESFKFPIKFYKGQKGVYTVVTMFVEKKMAKMPAFPITSISIRVN